MALPARECKSAPVFVTGFAGWPLRRRATTMAAPDPAPLSGRALLASLATLPRLGSSTRSRPGGQDWSGAPPSNPAPPVAVGPGTSLGGGRLPSACRLKCWWTRPYPSVDGRVARRHRGVPRDDPRDRGGGHPADPGPAGRAPRHLGAGRLRDREPPRRAGLRRAPRRPDAAAHRQGARAGGLDRAPTPARRAPAHRRDRPRMGEGPPGGRPLGARDLGRRRGEAG